MKKLSNYALLLLLLLTVIVSCKEDAPVVEEKPEAPKPITDFTFSTTATDPFTFKFTNASANYTKAFWRFGDDSTSVEVSPSHTFLKAQSYIVSLTSQNVDGVVSTKQVLINIAPKDLVSFYAVKEATPANTVKFINTTTIANQKVEWDFGDNTAKSNEPSPIHTYVSTTVPNRIFKATLKLTTLKGSEVSASRFTNSKGSLTDVTNTYIKNAGPGIIPLVRYGIRWGTPLDWNVNAAVKQRDGGVGGWDERNGNMLGMEAFNATEPDIINGKIEQTTPTLPAGEYVFHLDSYNFAISTVTTNFIFGAVRKASNIANDPLNTLPNANLVSGTTTLGFFKYAGTQTDPSVTGQNDLTLVYIPFVLLAPSPVTLGFSATIITDSQYVNARYVRLYKQD